MHRARSMDGFGTKRVESILFESRRGDLPTSVVEAERSANELGPI